MLPIALADAGQVVAGSDPVVLSAAKNEWTEFTLQIAGLPESTGKGSYILRLGAMTQIGGADRIEASSFSAFQVLSVPVNLNRAGYIRQTGALAGSKRLPRALLPLSMHGENVDLSALRLDVSPPVLWIDVHVPLGAKAGDYQGKCELLESGGKSQVVASMPLKLTVYDFVMPDDRHLVMASKVDWDALKRLYPQRFEAVTRQLLNRSDPRYAPPVRTLDQIITLAERNRAEVMFPDLQPTVKWKAARAPEVDWSDFDSVVSPWISGDLFADKTPLGYWPIPPADRLDRFDVESRGDYWSSAASHFDQNLWLSKSTVLIDAPQRQVDAIETRRILMQANEILRAHTRIRVTVPLNENQVEPAGVENPNGIDPHDFLRLYLNSRGVVFAAPNRLWPKDIPRPHRWLRTDLAGLIPYAGSGSSEADVRLWAWLAYLDQVELILWSSPFPKGTSLDEQADPGEMVWFYPGNWFGVDEPLPTIQLKWLRRAQQDFELLRLAELRGDTSTALVMARLITKPVQILPGVAPDPTYTLLSGTSDPKSWQDARQLLCQSILLHEPGKPVDPDRQNQLDVQTVRWINAMERPTVMPRHAQWQWSNAGGAIGNWVQLQLGVDLYNPSDSRPEGNTLGWEDVPQGWQHARPQSVRDLATYRVTRVPVLSQFNLDTLGPARNEPMELAFTSGYNQLRTASKVILPVAASDKREGQLAIDGSLGDWSDADAIQNGPLLRFYNRPALQRQELQRAATSSSIYSGWSNDQFYIAFKLDGVSTSDAHATRNFVDYQFRRAWGEDLCELLIQPIYIDNTVGPATHIVCKPSGHWFERKIDKTPDGADPWQAVETPGIRYASTIEGAIWRGELAIPWAAINKEGRGQPSLLRFNFVQHQASTGESASWAGPIDHGRDDQLMGLLHLRESAPTPRPQ